MGDVAVPYTVLEGGVDGVADGRQNAVLSNWPKDHGVASPAAPDTSYIGLKVAELRTALGARDLVTTGTRPELIARLVADDEDVEPEGDEPAA